MSAGEILMSHKYCFGHRKNIESFNCFDFEKRDWASQ